MTKCLEIAAKAPPSWEPSQPHPEPEVEEFASDVASGIAATDSFILHFEAALDGIDANSSSVRARAHRLSRRPDVEARILAIRKARSKPAEPLSEADLHTLMAEVTSTLAAAHDAAHDAGAPPQQLSALRKEITRHVGRSGRMRPERDVPFDASRAKAGLAAMLGAVPLCECPDCERTPEDPSSIARRSEKAMSELASWEAGNECI